VEARHDVFGTQTVSVDDGHVLLGIPVVPESDDAKATESRWKVGNGLDDGINVGPLVNKEGRDKVIELVDDAVSKGAKVLTGGKTPDGAGYFYPATVLMNVPDSAKMLNEEIFGPVAPITTFASDEEAVLLANSTEYGLSAAVHSGSLERARAVAGA